MNYEFPTLLMTIINVVALPPIIQWVSANVAEVWKKYLIAFGLSIVTAIIAVAWQGDFNTGQLMATVGIMITAAQAAYGAFWHKLLGERR